SNNKAISLLNNRTGENSTVVTLVVNMEQGMSNLNYISNNSHLTNLTKMEILRGLAEASEVDFFGFENDKSSIFPLDGDSIGIVKRVEDNNQLNDLIRKIEYYFTNNSFEVNMGGKITIIPSIGVCSSLAVKTDDPFI